MDRRGGAALTIAARVFTVCIYVFLSVPTIVIIGAAFSKSNFLTFPPVGFSLKWFTAVLSSGAWQQSFEISLLIVVIVCPIALAISVPAAYALARFKFRGRGAVTLLLSAPLMVPQVALGLALLSYYQRPHLYNTIIGLVIAHVLIVLPYVIRVSLVNLESLDRKVEQAAATLGAPFWRIFKDITLPLIRPGMVAGVIFASVLSFGELAVTAFIAGPKTTTVPLRIFADVQFSYDPSIAAVSTLFVVVSLIALYLADRAIGISNVLR